METESKIDWTLSSRRRQVQRGAQRLTKKIGAFFRPQTRTFEELYHAEVEHLSGKPKATSPSGRMPKLGVEASVDVAKFLAAAVVAQNEKQKATSKPDVRAGASGEPAVFFTPHDHFGLALSGGGIRSATFNLGILQGLARLRILSHVDYLATVSGGGYIGGFWTAWQARKRDQPLPPGSFPTAENIPGGENAEVRHLREFSRFLLPRVGLLETEFWAIVMTILGGMLPSLLAALAVVTVGWYGWVLGLIALNAPRLHGPTVTGVLIASALLTWEWIWRRGDRAEHNREESNAYIFTSLWSAFVVFLGLNHWSLDFLNFTPPQVDFTAIGWAPAADAKTALVIPGIVGLCSLALLALRILVARFIRDRTRIPRIAGVERVVTRMIGITAGLFFVVLMWFAAGAIAKNALRLQMTAGGTGLALGVFAWIKDYLAQPKTETRGEGVWKFLLSWAKRLTPKALAIIVCLLVFVLVGGAVRYWSCEHPDYHAFPFWIPAMSAVVAIFLTTWLIDPARIGMHEFYRARISRCYLGASNEKPTNAVAEKVQANRLVAERADDDLLLEDLKKVQRPIQLVCVAANNLSGDPLSNLYRGAKSAVISMNGITLGNETAALNDVRLSSALTASAAAFNSQMGRFSMDLGRAVGFLMSALNLRLGLWLPHPRNPFRNQYQFPGRFFFYELFSWSSTDGSSLHLSDGNHFENFGLYELIRRHCRYIIVSDCGADHEVAFDDLANVLRRVREDFGVEIELDISPLRPGADDRAKKHAVLGTIHYNGFTGMDKGTILYIKPSLTGDEPPDVAQYGTRNRAFPHESTIDQFYDEAQWESYRRLGEHTIDTTLGFFQLPTDTAINVPDRLFRDARTRSEAFVEPASRDFLDLSERCAALSHELTESGPARLRTEFFAEATVAASTTADDDIEVMGFLMQVAHTLEEIYVGADFERTWSHPTNEGLLNFMRRWAATPSFRRWWPVIGSLSGLGFRQFVKDRFHLTLSSKAGASPAQPFVTLDQENDPAGFFRDSAIAHQYAQTYGNPELAGRRLLVLRIRLLDVTGARAEPARVMGFVLVTEEALEGRREVAVTWCVDDLFVAESQQGGGYLSKLLDLMLEHYGESASDRRAAEFRVSLGKNRAQGKRPNRADQFERVRSIEFYKSRGFSYAAPEDIHTGAITLRRLPRPHSSS